MQTAGSQFTILRKPFQLPALESPFAKRWNAAAQRATTATACCSSRAGAVPDASEGGGFSIPVTLPERARWSSRDQAAACSIQACRLARKLQSASIRRGFQDFS